MEPIRVLQVVTIMNRGGLETMLMNYYRQIDRSKIQFDFLVHRNEKGHYDEEISRLGGEIYNMPQIRPGNYSTYFKMLKQFFLDHSYYRVVHSHINENSSFVLKAAKNARVPCRIVHSHISDLGIDIKLPFRLYARYSMRDNPNKYFACSKVAGEWLYGKKFKEKNDIVILNNAINTNEFKYDIVKRMKIREDLDLNDKLVIGHVGRFNKQKNHTFLIDIFKVIHNKNPNSMLIMVGDGDLRLDMEKKVENMGLSSAVKFLGIRSDIAEIMQGMDVFLFPSLFEGLPVVLVEAQAAGLNCIVSDTITQETNITGLLKFTSLHERPEIWAENVLTSTTVHQDTSEILRERGYDTRTMVNWLTEYYENNSINA
ncbi:glycosyltransferase family 1 protein [Cytobacillus sp. S13-E01]|uniref:glycosyltransferase family 1 protein n=1 Tax=Cytobacillus sp. S13-E01 TaxID=3031326 RepID=UPI0023D850CE|nr:glycosyltransferase family 1 protein [Cytobacillus sp. S13-E01]MDF0727773.1 glycosyltransferase family 1 protein [Cytobacillus sp. S13-E01]